MKPRAKCRGWRNKCGQPVRYTVTIAYQGARQFPSVWEMCPGCTDRAAEFVRMLREEHGREDVVDFSEQYIVD